MRRRVTISRRRPTVRRRVNHADAVAGGVSKATPAARNAASRGPPRRQLHTTGTHVVPFSSRTRLYTERSAPPDPMQAKMMWIMPLVFSVMFFFFPAGLVLYWLTNNILSIAQQWLINTRMGVPPEFNLPKLGQVFSSDKK